MVSRLFIARHGNTFASGSPIRRIGARTDLPLVDSGRAQAVALRSWFADRDIRPARIWTSPLVRCRETAAIIASPGHSRELVQVMPWLNEIDHGPDEGELEHTVISRVGVQALDDWDRHGTPPADWQVDPARRIADWQALFASPPAGDTLLITSNGTARFAVLACSFAIPDQPIKLRTGALGLIALQPDGTWQIPYWDLRPDAAQ